MPVAEEQRIGRESAENQQRISWKSAENQ